MTLPAPNRFRKPPAPNRVNNNIITTIKILKIDDEVLKWYKWLIIYHIKHLII